MTIDVSDALSFREAEATLARWRGRRVRVVLSHRASLQDIGAVPDSTLERVDPLPDELTGLAGNGIGLIFTDRAGVTILTLLVHEQMLDHAVDFGSELQVWLDDVEVIIERLEEP